MQYVCRNCGHTTENPRRDLICRKCGGIVDATDIKILYPPNESGKKDKDKNKDEEYTF